MIELKLPDMSCGHCVGAVTKAVKALDANATVEINLETKAVRIQSVATQPAIAIALTEAGYTPA
jgi:copper chaperone